MLPTIHHSVEHPRVIEDEVPSVDLVDIRSTGTTVSDTRSALVYHPSVRYPTKRRHREHRPDERWTRGWLRFAQRRYPKNFLHSTTDITPFKFQPNELHRIVQGSDFLTLKHEGANGLLQGLLTDIRRGITTREPPDDSSTKSCSSEGQIAPAIVSLMERRRVYGRNRAWNTSSRIVALLLWKPWKLVAPILYANLIMVVLGLLDDFALRSAGDRTSNWVISLAILAIVVIMALFQVLIQWRMVLQMQALHEEIEGPRIEVVRDGVRQKIYPKDIVVGDIVFLEAGRVVPCDGIFLSGHGVTCGELDNLEVKKVTIEHLSRMVGHSDPRVEQADCFLHAGDKVFEGSGRYVVTAISNSGESHLLPFDMYDRNVWSEQGYISERWLRKGSIMAAPLLFPLFMIKIFIQADDRRPGIQKGSEFINIVILWIFLMMVAYLPQRLPSPINTQHALMKHLINDKILLQAPHSCEAMTAVTDLCTDMTGTITQDRMTVISGLVGTATRFHGDGHAIGCSRLEGQPPLSGRSVDLHALNRCLSPAVQHIFNETITLTCVAIQDIDPDTGDTIFVGSATEVALLHFAKELQWPDFQSTRNNARILEIIPFSSSRMASGAFVDLGEGRRRLYLKGASEVLAGKCTHHVLIDEDAGVEIKTSPIDHSAESAINQSIASYAEQGLRTISLCYRDFDSWPPDGLRHDRYDVDIEYEEFAREMTFIGMVCIYNPIRRGVREVVETLRSAGIIVRMCTGDHPATAKSIANQCGIPVEHQQVVTGSTFADFERYSRWPKRLGIQVLARASPEDKARFVDALQRRNKVVAFLGDGANDRFALEAASVSFSMAVAGTEISRASDIVVLDQDFKSVTKILLWGQWLKESRAQFIDVYIPTSLTIIFLTFVSSLASSKSEPALSLVQILWITLLINPLAMLALSTDQPWLDTDLRISSSLPQGIYYLVAETLVVLFLFIFGHRFPGHPSNESTANVSDRTRTLIFNTMGFIQIFRTLVHWKVNRKRLMTITNWMFPIILACGAAVHLSIVLKGGRAFHVTPMSGTEWGSSMALSAFCVPLAFLVSWVQDVAKEAALKLG